MSQQVKSTEDTTATLNFETSLRVRWAEADIQGVVFNGHYLTYFDIGLTEYLRSAYDNDQAALHAMFDQLYVVKSTVEYQSPARFDDMIRVRAGVARVGRSSLTVAFEIMRGDELLVKGDNVYVYAPDGQSAPVPEDLVNRLQGVA